MQTSRKRYAGSYNVRLEGFRVGLVNSRTSVTPFGSGPPLPCVSQHRACGLDVHQLMSRYLTIVI